MSTPTVLDPCAGSRMMWFDKADPRTLFGDIRSEDHVLCDGRALSIRPDILMDFRDMPFEDETFEAFADAVHAAGFDYPSSLGPDDMYFTTREA